MTERKTQLTDFFQLHDKVVMQMDKEARSWCRDGKPDGTEGRIVGFSNVIADIPYGRAYKAKPPGMYIKRGAPVVLWEDGTAEYCGDVLMQDVAEYERRYEEGCEHMRKHGGLTSDYANPSAYFVPLPDLPFMEGDTVHVLSRWRYKGRWHSADYDTQVIRVDYYKAYHKQTRSDGSEWPYYDVTLEHGSGHTALNTKDLTLVKRGNLFHYYKGNKADIAFADLKEEVAFNHMIGKAEELRNPANSLYSWTLEEILSGMEKGEVDSLRVSNGFFGSGPHNCAYRLEDRDLAKRVREETLRGFDRISKE